MKIYLRRQPTNRSGFTLAELLVSIAILLVLIALMTPLLRNTVGKAKSLHCMSNLRQIGIATHAFAGDHAGTLPATITTGNYRGPEPWMIGWVGSETLPYGMAPPRNWYKTPGALAKYLPGRELRQLYRCPAQKDGVFGSGVGSNRMHDYTMFAPFCGANIAKIPLVSSVVNPLTGETERHPTPIFTEEEPAYGINDTYIDPDHTSINRMGTWHENYTTHYYAIDGSMQQLAWKTTPGPQCYAWSGRAPSGEMANFGTVSGWGSWNTR